VKHIVMTVNGLCILYMITFYQLHKLHDVQQDNDYGRLERKWLWPVQGNIPAFTQRDSGDLRQVSHILG
jgi:hypothetical protein